MKFTRSIDGISRATIRVSHRLTAYEMAAMVHHQELEEDIRIPLRVVVVRDIVHEVMKNEGHYHMPYIAEQHVSEEWDENRVQEIKDWINEHF